MKCNDFINIAKRIESELNTKYQLGGWGQQANGYYLFDCVCMIKSILWGFNFEKGGHGGASYKANGVPDLAADAFFEQCCYDKSSDFSKIEPGEIVYLDGHVGIYVGNNRVVEATAAWDNKVLLSSIDSQGRRTYNYRQVYTWKKHGKCKFVDYTNPTPTPKPEPTPKQQFKFNVGDKVVLSGHLYKNANGEGQGIYKKDCVCTILLRHEGIKPYNVDADNPGSYEGWVAECNLKLYEEPKKKLDIGVKVKTIGTGKATSYGEGATAIKGLEGTITNYIEGRPYPYLVNQDGWYKAEDLEII